MQRDKHPEQGFILMMLVLILLLAAGLAFAFLRIHERGLYDDPAAVILETN